MAKVELSRVSKIFPRGIRALDEVDLEARDGEILVLLGPNGSGKSTLLRLIAGLEELSSGEIRIGGSAVNGWPPRRRDVAMIFQGCVLYPHLTAEQNLWFGSSPDRGGWTFWIWNRLAGRLAGAAARKQAVRERVRIAAQLLGVEHLLDRFPRQLSGGECQRVALGRALVRQPAVFLLDEPWSNVDVNARRQLRRELKRVRGELGGAMILVTHDHEEALALGDRVAVMNAGRIHQVGLPAEIMAAPRTRFVAEYVGEPPMNFVAGSLGVFHGELSFETGDWRMKLDAGAAPRHGPSVGRMVWLGIRPDAVVAEARSDRTVDVRAVANAPIDGMQAIVGVVVGREEVSGDRYIHVKPHDPQLAESSGGPWVARPAAGNGCHEGAEVWLRFDRHRAMLFDQQSGSNLSLGLEVTP